MTTKKSHLRVIKTGWGEPVKKQKQEQEKSNIYTQQLPAHRPTRKPQ